jgi:hypothetical protein
MIVEDLIKGVKNKLDRRLNIQNSLSIIDVPKQSLLEKGNIVVLLNEKNRPVIVEFLKLHKYHFELKNSNFPPILAENILKSAKLFDTTDFDEMFDNDYYIKYSEMDGIDKKNVRLFVKNAENILTKEHLRFGKMSNESLKRTINIQNGVFTDWMEEHGFSKPNKQCLAEAYKEAHSSRDVLLKKRAVAAKCFYKISMSAS